MKNTLFEFEDYKDFLISRQRTLPGGGHGELKRLAAAAGMNPSILTQIFQKKKDLTLDQASDICEHLGLSSLEREYFITSVILQRSGKKSLSEYSRRKLIEIKLSIQEVKSRVKAEKALSDEAKAQFYTHWYYSGLRILCALPGVNSIESLASRINLSVAKTRQTINFLESMGLLQATKKGYVTGSYSTHLPADHWLVSRHHVNWRMKAIQSAEVLKSDELMFTSPVALSAKDFEKVRSLLLDAIESTYAIIDPSPSEEVACLNIDWFRW